MIRLIRCLAFLTLIGVGVHQAAAQEIRRFRGHTGRMYQTVFSPDGKLLATASLDKTVRVWDLETGEQKYVLDHPYRLGVYGLSFSPDSQNLATCSGSRITVWRMDNGGVRVARNHGHTRCVVYTPDGESLVTAASYVSVHVYDAKTLKLRKTLEASASPVWRVAISPDGRHLAAAGGSHGQRISIALWDMSTGTRYQSFMEDLGRVNAITFSPDGKTLASGGMSQLVKLWNVPDFDPAAHRKLSGRIVEQMWNLKQEDAEARQQAADALCEIGRPALGPLRAALKESKSDPVRSAIAQVVQTIETPTLKPRGVLFGYQYDINRLAYSPDGKILGTVAGWPGGANLILWDTDRDKELAAMDFGDFVGCIAFSPDGTLLAFAVDTDVHVVELADVLSGEVTARKIQYPDFEQRDALARTWDVVSCEVGGKPLEKAPLSQFVFTDTKVTIREEQKSLDIDYRLDTAEEPREFTLLGFPGQRGNAVACIYRLAGDTLEICLNLHPGGAAPSDFKTAENDGLMLLKLKCKDRRSGDDSQQ